MHDFVRWLAQDDLPRPPRLGPVDQAIGLITRGASVEGFVQVFGHIQIPLRLTSSYTARPLSCGYFVDPFREASPAELRLVNFPAAHCARVCRPIASDFP